MTVAAKLVDPDKSPLKPRVWDFYREHHHAHSRNGVSYAGIVTLTRNRTVILSGPTEDDLNLFVTEHLTDVESVDLFKLENIQ